ncbi:MAG TPA: toll/interleukin-1 receptor domain-containing protein [Pyrinomonadaceae bacterium]|nr:toll/interleukin-1 receptor domain-containing protein [Pyrinomonadaceae bacterium]
MSIIKCPLKKFKKEGFYRAGVRWVELLRANSKTKDIPVVLYSVFDESDLEAELSGRPANVRFLPKSSEPYSLIRLVGSLVAAQKPIKLPLTMSRDVFICHATEDKDQIADPLVKAFEITDITVWYDKAEIRWGDSLFLKIKEGLRISKYVLAILSKHSVGKPWPLQELNIALNREILTGETRVLPLLVGTAGERKAILEEFDLKDKRRYEVWTGDAMAVVQQVKEKLK